MSQEPTDSQPVSTGGLANLPVVGGDRREVFFGPIAPLGVHLDPVITELSNSLRDVGYDANEVRLTDIFKENSHWYDAAFKTPAQKYEMYIAAGDNLRRESERDDILALYSIAKLQEKSARAPDIPALQNVAHIFRQIKRVEEISAYKDVFGRNILFIACYTPKKQRVKHLVNEMLKTERGELGTTLESRALGIIAKDEDERNEKHGQRMVECYPNADYVIDCSSHETLRLSIKRFTDIYFGSPFISPAPDEYASYIANAASYRSLDLSRQVGAAIFGPNCEVISLGCNEVPRAGAVLTGQVLKRTTGTLRLAMIRIKKFVTTWRGMRWCACKVRAGLMKA